MGEKTRIRLGIAATVFGRNRFLTPADVALLPDIGVHDLEISFLHNRLDHRNEPYMEALVQTIQRLNIRVPSVHALAGAADADLSSLDREKREWAVDQIRIGADLLARLGGRFLVVHVNHTIQDDEDRTRRIDCVVQSLQSLVDYSVPLGIVIAVENLPGKRLCSSPYELLALVERFHPNQVGICFDTGHANLEGDVITTFRRLQHRIVTFHISDNNGLQDDHGLPYSGTIDWLSFMRVLNECSYKGVFMYEVGPQKDALQGLNEIKRNFARLVP